MRFKLFGIDMAFDRGITKFWNNFLNVNQNESSYQQRIQELKNRMSKGTKDKPFVVISGAGPAGLMRAIQSICNGNPTKIIEKRSKDASGRINAVVLTESTIAILKYYGIYAYLLEKKLIYPPNKGGYICVRLNDLERALKTVLQELSTSKITYESQILNIEVESSTNKIQLITESSGKKIRISDVDIFVNAEGAHSSTNELLNIERTEDLPYVPIIVAMCRDDRPEILNLDTFFVYVEKSLDQVAITIYYHTIFFFQFLFSDNFRTEITAAFILPTPGQNYISCAFSNTIQTEFETLKKKENKAEYVAFALYWINLSICAANMISLLSWFKGGFYLHTGHHLRLEQFEIVDIGADHANINTGKVANSKILLAGDASATVDPTTGLGCNSAIQSSLDFLELLWDYDDYNPEEKILVNYQNKTNERIKYGHNKSREMRSYYRPDALAPTMFKTNPSNLPSTQNNTSDSNKFASMGL